MKHSERFLPNQACLSALYQGDPQLYDAKMYQVIDEKSDLQHCYRDLDIEVSEDLDPVEYGTSPVCMRLFEMMFRMANVKSVLEIGAFIGVSSMCFANMVGPDGKVVVIEKYAKVADVSERNFHNNGLADRIEMVRADAEDVIKTFTKGQFDFIYIDGDKANYWHFFEMVRPLLVAGNIVVVDDVLFNGDVLNDECVSEKGAGCKQVLDKLQDLSGFHRSVLPISNGIAVLIKE